MAISDYKVKHDQQKRDAVKHKAMSHVEDDC